MRPTKEWIELYNKKAPLLTCETDLNAYFTADEIAGQKLDRMTIGNVSLPSGEIIVCDPLVSMDTHSKPYFLTVTPGEYEVMLSVVMPSDDDCARYAAARICFSDAEAVRYVEALTGDENLTEVNEPGDGFGFGVDAGLACICDVAGRDAFIAFECEFMKRSGKDSNIYDDYFSSLMAENFQKCPQYQRDGGDWLNWQVPGTDYHIPIFQSGFGDGYYPVWFGYDKSGNICSLVVQFIDIEEAYSDDETEDD